LAALRVPTIPSALVVAGLTPQQILFPSTCDGLAEIAEAGWVTMARRAAATRVPGYDKRPRDAVERVHVTVTATAPQLSPKTWYGMPAYADADGKVVVFFQDSGKFNYRYSTLGFQDAANLDDGDLWPVSYALQKWSPVVEKKVVELVKAAVS
jgi:uncharacterized protein YdhG (YjbR/CyaY superfamily)